MEATTATATNGESETKTTLSPPYVSWMTLQNTIERMETEGDVPSRIDRSYISNMTGTTQAQFRQACRWLGLTEPDGTPTDLLKRLVHEPNNRKVLVAELLRTRYPGPTGLPPNATQQMLEDEFRKLGSNPGETMRKGVAFFLNAAKYAELELSARFKQPKRLSGSGTRKTARKSPEGQDAQHPPTPGPPPSTEAPALIRDLLKQLPPEGQEWQRSKAEAWLGIAALTFGMVYKLDSPVPAPKLPDPAQGGDPT